MPEILINARCEFAWAYLRWARSFVALFLSMSSFVISGCGRDDPSVELAPAPADQVSVDVPAKPEVIGSDSVKQSVSDKVIQNADDKAVDITRAPTRVESDVDRTVTPLGFPGRVGVAIDIRDGLPEVIEVLAESAAADSGVKVGDRITSIVVEENAEPISMAGKDYDEVVCYLMGLPGSEVKLHVLREGREAETISISRQEMGDLEPKAEAELPGWRLTPKNGGLGIFVHTATICRFPKSRRYYPIFQDGMTQLKAFPERYEGKRYSFVTRLLFPEFDPSLNRLELRLFNDMSSPMAICGKDDPLFAGLAKADPGDGQIAIMHVKMMPFQDSQELYGRLEEVALLGRDGSVISMPLGANLEYDKNEAVGEASNDSGEKPRMPFELSDVVAVLGKPDRSGDDSAFYANNCEVTRTEIGIEYSFNVRNGEALLFASGLFSSRLFSKQEGSQIMDFIDSVGEEKKIGRFRVRVSTSSRGWRTVALSPAGGQ